MGENSPDVNGFSEAVPKVAPGLEFRYVDSFSRKSRTCKGGKHT